jgi:hypothetical protein
VPVQTLAEFAGVQPTTIRRWLAELGQLCGWCGYDAGQPGLAQRYYITALRAAHSADARPLGAHILDLWPIRPHARGSPERP